MKSKILTLLSMLVILALIAYPMHITSVKASPEAGRWWNTNWKYRIPVTVNNPSSTDLYEFQVLITLDTQALISDGKMNSDCSDLRVMYQGEELPYWIEPYTINSDATRIWVKVPRIEAGESITIYIYYGNPSATSTADPNEVFLFFEDFNSEEDFNARWEIQYNGGAGGYTFGTEDDVTYIEFYGTSNGYTVWTKKSFSGNVAVNARIRAVDDNYDHDLSFWIMQDWYHKWGGFPGDKHWDGNDPDEVHYYMIINRYGHGAGSTSYNRTSKYTHVQFQWQIFSVARFGNKLVSEFPKFYPGCHDSLTLTPQQDMIDEGRLGITTSIDYSDTKVRIDWVLVRKYVHPFPSYTIGEEETFIYLTVKSVSGNVFPGISLETWEGASQLSSGVSNSSGCAILGAKLGTLTVKIKYRGYVLEEKTIDVTDAAQNIEVNLDFEMIIVSSVEISSTNDFVIPYLCMATPLLLLGLRRRKSIQTWVAIVLAIVITIAIAVPIYIWVAHITSPAESFRPTELAVLDCSMQPNKIELTLKNVGEYTDALYSITIKLGSTTLKYYNPSTTVAVITPSGVALVPLGNIKLKPGATYEIVIPFEWTAGYTYTIKILGKANSMVETELTS